MKKLKIIKIGGNIIDNPVTLHQFLKNLAQLKGPKILIHGGGKLASKMAKDIGVPVEMKDGRRITNKATLDIITMV